MKQIDRNNFAQVRVIADGLAITVKHLAAQLNLVGEPGGPTDQIATMRKAIAEILGNCERVEESLKTPTALDKLHALAEKWIRSGKGEVAITDDDLKLLGLKPKNSYTTLAGNRVKCRDWEGLCIYVYEKVTSSAWEKIKRGAGWEKNAASRVAKAIIDNADKLTPEGRLYYVSPPSSVLHWGVYRRLKNNRTGNFLLMTALPDRESAIAAAVNYNENDHENNYSVLSSSGPLPDITKIPNG